MTKFFYLSAILLPYLFLAGCASMLDDLKNNNGQGSESIPNNFDWRTTCEIDCEVEVSSTLKSEFVHVVRIYSDPLLKEGKLLASGSAKPGVPYRFKLTVPTTVTKLYVEVVQPDGTHRVREITAKTGQMRLSAESMLKLRTATVVPNIPILAEPVVYDEILSGNKKVDIISYQNGETQLNEVKSYLIPGDVTCSGLTFNNWKGTARLYVKGTLNMGSPNVNMNMCSLIILDGGKVIFKNLQTSSADIQIAEGGMLVVSNKLNYSHAEKIINKGMLRVEKNADINNSAVIYNFGTLDGGDDNNLLNMKLSNNVKFYNYGKIKSDYLELNSSVTLLNAEGAMVDVGDLVLTNRTVLSNMGKIYVDDNLNMTSNTKLENFCMTKTANWKISNSTFELYSGGLFKANDLQGDNSTVTLEGSSLLRLEDISKIYGVRFNSVSTDYALIDCTGAICDLRWANTKFNGKIELVHQGLTNGDGENGEALYPANLFSDGAKIVKKQANSIAKTSCNGGDGSMGEEVTDSDGDGVPDSEDKFPNDPERAFISYFPSESTWGTHAFEDLWPAMGDYDLNDMVMGFQVSWISNASNQVVEMGMRSKVRAIGSCFPLSLAFQLDELSPAQIKSVTGSKLDGTVFGISGNGTENGQSKAVIPVFDQDKSVWQWQQRGQMGNTVDGGGRIVGDSLHVNVLFASPVDQSLVSMNRLNLFITTNGRGNEIHLNGFAKTDKGVAPVDLTKYDLSDNNLYMTRSGLIWALMIPETFNYPFEKIPLKEVYTYFEKWTFSGGALYPDWYQDKVGYRTDDKIYR